MARNDVVRTDGSINWDTVGGFKDSIDGHTAQLADIALNVKNYGAKGDWNGTTGTDDTSAIQSAINAINSYGVILLDNNYIANASSITIPSGKTIVFRSKTPIYVNSTVTLFSRSGDLIFDHIDFYNINSSAGNFVDFQSAGTYGKVIADHCKIDGFATCFGAVGNESKITNNEINLRQVTDPPNQTFYGVLIQGNSVIVEGNTFSKGRHHVYFTTGCQNGIAKGNIFNSSEWNAVELNATSSATANNNILVSDNVFNSCGLDSSNNYSSLHCSGYFTNMNIENNTINGVTGKGIHLEGTSLGGADCVVSNNKVINGISTSTGIRVTNCTDVIVKNNDVNMVNPIIIETNSTNVKAFGNSIKIASGGTWWIQLSSCSNVDVSDNVCQDTPSWTDTYIQAGIFLSSVTGTFTGKGNKIAGYEVILLFDGAPIVLKKGMLGSKNSTIPAIYHHAGDLYTYGAPLASDFIGQVCVSSGNPALFKTFGPISA